ncbi:MAG TPA: tetratricopeptide repeat protein [Bryobacteraceae bacterium]|nr:tetratricopeptide repeat protein [Bryobacteraceae bacterium]
MPVLIYSSADRSMATRSRRDTSQGPKPPAPEVSPRIPPLRLAFALTLLLAGFATLPWVRANARLASSILGAAAVLLLLNLWVRRRAARAGRVLSFRILPRPVHYVQLMMHTSIYVYWGWYWREVYHYAPLIAAQVVFVYALDMLVCWWRRDRWILGFGPFPIVLSTNLFLWFKDDWFFLQFLMISTGVLCKEFVTWQREGRRIHIFNPSAIALALFSLGLIVTRSTHISWAEEVAVTLGRPPNIYIEIFLLGLVVQALFSVTLVTLAAAAALYLLNLIYTDSTGVYHFVDSNIPAAVFLGLHLLVTDPATSPRKNLGKVMFGALYGGAVFGLYSVLGWFGAPTFYDKLLCVPPLNLTVRFLDRFSLRAEAWLAQQRVRPLDWIATRSPRQANLAYMGVWVSLFAWMAATGFVGPHHPGSDPEFWHQACEHGRANGCATWIRTMNVSCQHGSGRTCLTLGVVYAEGRLAPRDLAEAGKNLARACDLGTPNACAGLVAMVEQEGPAVFRPACDRGDGESCFVLASLDYAGKGVPRDLSSAVTLFRQSCADEWWRGCGGLGECYRAGQGVAADTAKAIEYFEKACRGGIAASCFSVANLYRGRKDEALARQRFQQACDVSLRSDEDRAAYFKPGAAAIRDGGGSQFCSAVEP